MLVEITNNCGRRGCSRQVVNGMQCRFCSLWFHETCTGLSAVQYTSLSAPDREFLCMVCITTTIPSVHLSSLPTVPDTLLATQDTNSQLIGSPSPLQAPNETEPQTHDVDTVSESLQSLVE
jgi:hypothetical protein